MMENGKMIYKMGFFIFNRYGIENWKDGSRYEGYYIMGKKHG